ncbi:MAG: hypothetical protein AB7P17_01885 [Nitrospirales bacterium]|nr:hypothetical protein [Nitrospirales bacterium]
MEVFVSSIIQDLEVLDPGELCRVSLLLPSHVEVDGQAFRIQDDMRPGTAFLAKPFGVRTQKYRRRMYTRSNVAKIQPGLLETFINHTHKDLSDTSIWWQSEEVLAWKEKRTPIEIKVQLDLEASVATVYENTKICKSTNLRLEDEGKWEDLSLVCVAFGTGITPFLAYLRYWIAHRHRPGGETNGGALTLIVSARHFSQLMCHDELSEIAKTFPEDFVYHPILTRTWPPGWEGMTGRILSVSRNSSEDEHIDLSKLLKCSPDLAQRHLRLCGNGLACRQIVDGLEQSGVVPLSIRSESW